MHAQAIERTTARIGIATLLLLAAAAARAQDALVVRAVLGFDGCLPVERPAPLTIRLENRSAEPLVVTLGVDERGGLGGALSSLERTVALSAGATKQVTILVMGAVQPEGKLRIRTSRPRDIVAACIPGEPVSRKATRTLELSFEDDFRARAGSALLLALGGRGRQLAQALATEHGGDRLIAAGGWLRREADRAVTPAALEIGDAPDTALAYAGVQTIAWIDPDPTKLETPAQLEALRRYVLAGGRLVLLGARAPEGLEDPWLKRFAGYDVARLSIGPYPSPTRSLLRDRPWSVEGPLLVLSPAVGTSTVAPPVPLGDSHWHLRTERPLGQGSVVCAAFDPLLYDIGSPPVLAEALNAAAGTALFYGTPGGAGAGPVAAPDLGGAPFISILRNANVLTPSFGLYVLIGFAFVVLVGPVDWIVLKRLKKLHWSPFTLLAYTLIFTAGSFAATLLIFAPDAETNRIAVLDLVEDDDGGEHVFGFVYHGVYAPTGGAFTNAVPGFEVFGCSVAPLSWDPYGGPRAATTLADEPRVFLDPGVQPLAFRQPFNSFRATAAELRGTPRGWLDARIATGEDGMPALTVINRLELPFEHGVLAAARGAIEIPALAPGQTATVPLPMLAGLRRRAGSADYPRAQALLASLETSEPVSGLPDPDQTNARLAWSSSRVRELARWLETLSLAPEPRHVNDYSFTGAYSPPVRPPWSLRDRLSEGTAVLMGLVPGLPYDEGSAGGDRGFTFALVRRVLAVPEE